MARTARRATDLLLRRRRLELYVRIVSSVLRVKCPVPALVSRGILLEERRGVEVNLVVRHCLVSVLAAAFPLSFVTGVGLGVMRAGRKADEVMRAC
jgi:hypothetical protein